MSTPLISGLAQLASYSTRVAKATTMLSKIRDEDVEVATTPREVVARIGGRTLYRIAIDGEKRVETPVLVVYAMVGHWTILDLQPDRSFLRNLAEGGCEVYMLDWGHPTAADQFDDFSDLVDVYMDGFIDAICDRHDIPSVNLLGICQGGVLSLIYASLHPEKIRNLITCVTPVDFHADKQHERVDHGFMNVWVRNISPEEVDLMIDSFGNVSGEVGGAFFSMMTPYRSLSKYCLTLVDVGQDREKLLNFLRMEKWLADRARSHGGVSPAVAEGPLPGQQDVQRRAPGRRASRRPQERHHASPELVHRDRPHHSAAGERRARREGRQQGLFTGRRVRGAYRRLCQPRRGQAAQQDRGLAREAVGASSNKRQLAGADLAGFQMLAAVSTVSARAS